jgi:hypothetical protein
MCNRLQETPAIALQGRLGTVTVPGNPLARLALIIWHSHSSFTELIYI